MLLWNARQTLSSPAVDLTRPGTVVVGAPAWNRTQIDDQIRHVTNMFSSQKQLIEAANTQQGLISNVTVAATQPLNMTPVDAVFSNTHATRPEGTSFFSFQGLTSNYWFLGLAAVFVFSLMKK